MQKRWLPPKNDTFKLNVDAAQATNGLWSFSAVVRDVSDLVIAAACWSFQCFDDANVVEVVVVRQGLLFARDCCIDSLVVESNCLSVVLCFQQAGPNWSYLGQVVQECISLGAHFKGLFLSYISRSCNNAAHLLAKWASQNPDQVWLEVTSL